MHGSPSSNLYQEAYGVSYTGFVEYTVEIGIPTKIGLGHPGQGGLAYLSERGKTREWVEQNIATPRREGRDILFQGVVFNWNDEKKWPYKIMTINILRIAYDEPSPYARGRRNDRTQPTTVDVTHEFITGAPGEYASSRVNTSNTLADFSDEQLIEELRRRLGRRG
jgi:hypothetical protein